MWPGEKRIAERRGSTDNRHRQLSDGLSAEAGQLNVEERAVMGEWHRAGRLPAQQLLMSSPDFRRLGWAGHRSGGHALATSGLPAAHGCAPRSSSPAPQRADGVFHVADVAGAVVADRVAHQSAVQRVALAWVAHQLFVDPLNLFNTNIFYPEPRTLAYSDAMLLQGMIATPLIKAGMKPLLVMNLMFLAGIITSGAGMYLLARRLTGHTASGDPRGDDLFVRAVPRRSPDAPGAAVGGLDSAHACGRSIARSARAARATAC